MVKRFLLQDYKVTYEANSEQYLILITGHEKYYDIICDAFPSGCSDIFRDYKKAYDWGVYLKSSDENLIDDIKNLLNMLTYAVYIDDGLNQSFALDFYYKPYWNDPDGGQTLAGNLVHKSKYYPSGTHEHTKQVHRLIDYMKRFIQLHPSYKRSDYIVGIPFFGEKDFDLPTYIANQVSQDLNIKSLQRFVTKIKSTKSMKSLETEEEKRENIRQAFSISDDIDLSNKSIIVVDDVYRSGITMAEFSTLLNTKGANVLGLVAAKTIRD